MRGVPRPCAHKHSKLERRGSAQLSEGLGHGCSAEDDQFHRFGFGLFILVGGRGAFRVSSVAAAGAERKCHSESKKQCKDFFRFHVLFSPFVDFLRENRYHCDYGTRR